MNDNGYSTDKTEVDPVPPSASVPVTPSDEILPFTPVQAPEVDVLITPETSSLD